MPKSWAQSSSTRKAPWSRTTSRTCSARSVGPLRPGGVGVVRLRVEHPGAGLVERAGQLVRGRDRRGRWAPGRCGPRPARRPGWRPSTSGTPSAAAARLPTRARKMELSPLWLPGSTMTSLGVGGVTPSGLAAPSSCANQDCSSGRPATGGRDRAVSPRAARVRAERTRRSGKELAVGVAGVEGDDVVRGAAHGRRRPSGSGPAASAGLRSASRSPTGRAVRTARTNVPTPGSGLDEALAGERRAVPSAPSRDWRGARRPGLAWTAAGRRAAAVAIQSRRSAAIRELLSSFMTQHSSATLDVRPAVSPAAVAGLMVGAARSSGVLLHRAVHPGRRRRALAAVHRLRPRGRGGRPGRVRPWR